MKKVKAFIIRAADGEISELHPLNGEHFDLKELQNLVGGYIEPIYFRNPIHLENGASEIFLQSPVLMVDEDGKQKQLPRNEIATQIFRQATGNHPDYIVGNAVFIDRDLLS